MNSAGRFVFLVILGTFFISGLAGLVYQVVWTRYLALFLGHTSYAVVAVLAAFMGGLAVGNAWLGSVVDRVKRPLLFYAGLELGIGIFALAFPHYYELVHAGFLGVVRATQPTGAVRLALQFLFAAVTILLPTVLMGATLPALTKFITRSLAELRGKVAALYAINSSGAVAGTLLADWWWIPELGLELTVYLGATLSLLIGLVALILSRTEGEATAEPAAAVGDETFTPVELKLALIGIGVSGFVAMLYEVAWTRLLGLALGSSTHAYSLMLATFISGIAAGGWVIYRWRTQANTLRAFAFAELALALTLLGSVWFYDLLPFWFSRLASWLARRPEAFPLYELFQAAICFAVMFVPAMCLGMTLPLISRVATSELARTGRSVGVVFAINTLGTVLGAVLTGLVLLPWLGLAHTFIVGIALNLTIAVLVLGFKWQRHRGLLWLTPVMGLGLVVVAGHILEPRWRNSLSQGLWRFVTPPGSVAEFRALLEGWKIAYYRDGAGSTVTVVDSMDSQGERQFLLRVNGKTDASSRGDLSTQILAGQIPMLLHPSATNALVVGLGSGVTIGSLLQHPTIQRVDVVEISPEVVECAGLFFAEANLNALKDPRTVVAVEDAKTFLKTTTEQYDLIITEPSNPWMAGVAAVFSREYYEDCRAHLKPGGMVAQWVQIYETDDATLGTVVATFSTAFPHISVWQTSAGDLLLIGAPSPPKVELTALAGRFFHPPVFNDLSRVGLKTVPSLLALELLPFDSGASLPAINTFAHSDYLPVLEYAAQRGFFVRSVVRNLFEVSESASPRPRTLLGDWLAREKAAPADFEALADCFTRYQIPQVPLVRSAMQRWLELQPTNAVPLRMLERLSSLVPAADSETVRLLQRPEYRLAMDRGDLSLIRSYTDLLMNRHRIQRTPFYIAPTEQLRKLLETLAEADPERRGVYELRLAELRWDLGDDDGFLALALRGFASAKESRAESPFAADPRAPRLVIARMLELFGRRGDVAKQRQVVEESFAQRFVGEQSGYREPILEFWTKKATADALTKARR